MALVVAAVPFVVAIPAAFAGVGFGVTPTLPSSVAVGQTGLPASIQVFNNSTSPESSGNVNITALNMVPACGTTSVVGSGDCPAGFADPGVFQLSPTGTGEVGTACAGQTFIIAVIDPSTGQVTFAPNGGSIVLGPPGTNNSVCRIDFTFNAVKAPTKPAGTSAPNTVQTAQIGFAAGTATINGNNGTGSGSSFVTVALAHLGITTTATATNNVGNPITDTATLSAAVPPGPAPTGTITFTLFGPNNATCTGAATFSMTVPVNSGTGSYTSGAFAPTASGSYRWVAAYSGDANNAPATTACGDAGETSTVSQATPTIVTTASGAISIGGSISDAAVLSGGFNPTGTITFKVFGPSNPTCTGTGAFTSAPVTVAGNGTYASGPFTPSAAGSYNWVAAYTGDANNATVTSACGAANETSTVSKANPTIVTTASSPVPIGGTISDAAVLSGGAAPTGTITFTVYGPSNPTCTGAATFTSNTSVAGNGTYNSTAFTPTSAGTYRFVATYNGDATNNPATSACGSPNESAVVAKSAPAIVTTASPSVPAGGTISDAATLSGGFNLSGTITFTLFGPNNSTCTGTPVFTSTVPVSGNGVYPSPPFTVTTPGTYNWVAAYSGDTNNNNVNSPCGAANESVVVTPATPAISTVASASVPVGGTITDTATLSGGANPTGTITFTSFGPNNATCTGTATFTSTVPVTAGNGNYTSPTFAPTATGTYRFVASYNGDANNASVISGCNDANESVIVTPAAHAPNDFDGDGRTDIAVFRPSAGTWYVNLSGGGTTTTNWGASGDIPVPGDYNGDGKSDIAVFRPSAGTWYVNLSGGGTTTTNWGANGDSPIGEPPA
ncbi:MAG: hypothetical protein QOG97_2404 [Acidimicrobiaceae bacterium]|nr:hypothetical protein [Acidimicrobiaceae bacterium]